jgi:6-phosphogluconolactonase
MNPSIEILPSLSDLIDRAYAKTIEGIGVALADRPICTLVLSGGSTPKPLYERLAAADLPWDRIHLFWGDERYVPATDPDSNYGMTRSVWIDRCGIPAANVHPMTMAENPIAAAAAYEAHLAEFFGIPAAPGDGPEFDVMLLGMGDDGHTASLFPHTAALGVTDRWVTVGEKSGQPRLTLTVPVINRSRQVLFLVAGASKRPALAQVWADQGDAQTYPSRLIRAENLTWLLDAAAGAVG